MNTLTIFTPAYNRAHTITRTYESLCRQTNDDFEWLIVNDGSSDDTEQLVISWLQEGFREYQTELDERTYEHKEGFSKDKGFRIHYIYQQNQGMHGAHNTAYRYITTELNTCIDSDDYMPNDAVENIVTFWKENKNTKYAGFIGLDQREDGSIIGSNFPDDMNETTLMGFYANGGTGDKKLVYRTDIIKQHPEYPLFEGERYVGLAYKYMLIDQEYKMLTLNKPLVIVEYQTDGSSNMMWKQYWTNPKGFAFFRKTEMVVAPTLKRKFISCIHYVSSSIISKNWKFLKESPQKLMTIAAIIPGTILFCIIKSKVKNNRTLVVK